MLLDQFGREIRSNKPILEEVAIQTIRDRYASYPSQGLTPERLATIFKEADQGDVTRQAELFEEMEEKDLHLLGVLQTRKLAVGGLDWEVLPASDSAEDKRIAAAAKEMLEYIENFEDALKDTLDAIGKGFDVQEIIWDMSEGQVWAKELKWIHQRRFTFNSPTVLLEHPRLLTDENPIWGEDLLPHKFIVHKYRARSGATARGGLLRPCSYMYLFKNYDIKDWVIFNELFSVPMRVGKYKPGAGAEEKEALKRAVFNWGSMQPQWCRTTDHRAAGICQTGRCRGIHRLGRVLRKAMPRGVGPHGQRRQYSRKTRRGGPGKARPAGSQGRRCQGLHEDSEIPTSRALGWLQLWPGQGGRHLQGAFRGSR
jgi:phage gp29-like protein